MIRSEQPGYSRDREALLRRLRRIEGQVQGLQRMVREDRYCIDVLTQLAAVKAALDGVGLLLLEDHTSHCVNDAIASGKGEDCARELSDAIARLVKA